jgi:hypothetical protein
MKRTAEDVLAEMLRRHRYGLVRPLWQDLPENGMVKTTWLREARRMIEELAKLGWSFGEIA